ncbi:hypothetical protein [Metabacillus sp. RGM 3146]|uniref:hypothetical protein n=1 Tax=Metabacillus sp. RGM 3146 TaxID=3401092 RepID=UPI003B9D5D58
MCHFYAKILDKLPERNDEYMSAWILAMLLYFPEDKREYIPAVITTVLFVLSAFAAFRLIQRQSKKEQKKTEWLYHQVNLKKESRKQDEH